MTRRTPAALKELAGTARLDRAVKATGAARLIEAPRPPSGLTLAAARHWRSLARQFTAAGLLAATDLPLLRLLSEALADEAEARAILAREGTTIEAGSGGRKQHPAIGMGQAARQTAIRLLLELGGSPAARQHVEALPAAPEPGSPWARLKLLQGG